jgi:uncharacterized protein YcsI (UPF0317 family)
MIGHAPGRMLVTDLPNRELDVLAGP